MISLKLHNGGWCPVLLCEACGTPVNEVNGRIVWATPEELHVCHWLRCMRTVEQAVAPDGGRCSWRPLGDFLRQLAYNTRVPLAAWREVL